MFEKIFKAYDIRGIYPTEINEETVYFIAQAYVKKFKPKSVVLGKDVRLSSPSLWQVASQGFLDLGIDVIDIGTVTTDMLYFAVANFDYDGGLMISASHNPKEYNGIKMVGKKAHAISSETGLLEIKKIASLLSKKGKRRGLKKGKIIKKDFFKNYKAHVLSFIKIKNLKPIKIVANANFGMAGQFFLKIIKDLPIKVAPLNFNPNGHFPKGKPDPMIPENRKETVNLIKKEKPDFGISWDADADRCFFFDEKSEFIEPYFITVLLADYLLEKFGPKQKIIYDPRLIWAIEDAVKIKEGIPLINKAGHTFIKDRMRKEKALFAGEASAHYYFRDNFYCDNGLIPFFLIWELVSNKGESLKTLVEPLENKYFVSGEDNFEVKDPKKVLSNLKNYFKNGKITEIDGLSVEYPDWRFNIRPSNTEPVVRLNIEARKKEILKEKEKEILELIKNER